MSNMNTQTMIPMQVVGLEHLLERTYRESGRYQHVRETLLNALQAGATKVEFGVEWQAVAAKKVYRRIVADNGTGMTADQLATFFSTYGQGGKPVGGVHENFGLGAKTSLLPWNTYGLVVVSWVEGKGSMIWVRRTKTGYGLRTFRVVGADGQARLEPVTEPFVDAEHGCDWAKVGPKWVRPHGTVLVYLGKSATEHTILGDTQREEGDLKGVASYLNRRMWKLGEAEVTVEEFRQSDPKTWPRAAGGSGETRTQRRQISGALHYVTYPGFAHGGIAHKGHLDLKDGTKVWWWLWDGKRPEVSSYAAATGYTAALYQNELYDVSTGIAVYRAFGVTAQDVRQRLWLVAEPPPLDERGRKGVYPRTDRNALMLQAGAQAGALPWTDWGAEFADRMPEAIRDALRKANQITGTIHDVDVLKRLEARFGSRWRAPLLRAGRGGQTVDPQSPAGALVAHGEGTEEDGDGDGDTVEPTGSTPGGTHGPDEVGVQKGPRRAKRGPLGVGIPSYRIAEKGEIEPGYLAAWAPHDPHHPEGVVILNGDHTILKQEVKYWRDRFASHLGEDVEREVIAVYGEEAVTKIAHSEALKGVIPLEDLRSDAALTMSLLGLMGTEAILAPRLGAKFGRSKRTTN